MTLDTHLLLGGVDVGVAVVDVPHLVLKVELCALRQAGLVLGGGHRSRHSQGSEGHGPGQEVAVQEVEVVARVTKPSVRVVVAWLETSEPWIVA